MIPTYNLLATQCPTPPVATLFLTKQAAKVGNGNAPVALSIAQGDILWRTNYNANALQLDLTGRYGGGGWGIAWGLGLQPGSGLTVSVAAGHAMIDGVVEIAAPTSIAVPDNTARVWIWLRQSGLLTAVPTSLTPPTGACCLLGSVTTSGGVVTGIDLSGVVYLRGGVLLRQTADAGAPSDTPPSSLQLIQITQGGVYWWTGSSYVSLASSFLSYLFCFDVTLPGPLAAPLPTPVALRIPYNFKIASIALAVLSAPVGSALIMHPQYNGSDIWTNSANWPTIAAGQTSGGSTGAPDGAFTMSAGGIFTAQLTSVGSTTAAQTLLATLY